MLQFARYDMSKPSTCNNIVLMSTHAIQKFNQSGHESIPADIQKRIEKRLASIEDPNNELY